MTEMELGSMAMTNIKHVTLLLKLGHNLMALRK
jgi:hypothetical protein